MPDIQGGYSERQGLYALGQIAESQFKDVVSRTYVGAGALAFGLALMYNGTEGEADFGGSVFDGIVVSKKVIDPVGATVDTFVQNDTVGLMKQGSIVVKPTTAFIAGDPVYFTEADGTIQNAAAAGRTLIAGAVFETNGAANALGVIHLS